MIHSGLSLFSVCVGFQAQIPVLVLLSVGELLDAVQVDRLLVCARDDTCCVVRVLDLHLDESRLVQHDASLRLLAHGNAHVHVETLVDLVLAVLDAGDLSGALGREGVGVDTVDVAATEEELGVGSLHERLAFVVGVVGC